ncbi:LicD family protein [Lactococcus lactis]|jgi:lipopolysaccharide cholinephosphotransferase|uniref:LicD family protein n=1 Tax=Lactococcus lactis subsp. lactis TaxID=1360 RepID=A0A0V8AV64_LACLL|nr:LicD family protein [Lactococcus lactis]MDN6243293.1 LicD family protein [Tetragenococcus koreensis]ARE19828.1 LicD family protein [Lactococcus lactis subsp. lactis]KST80385.1 Lipopolysaccharide cholinephosphotransferase LicD1 [Lactococcus lactis subsp. lactis]MCB6850804.1 LicD family protein [Lactococcus lactis]MCC4120781.1 LicD family protein [Lactococcus lactis]
MKKEMTKSEVRNVQLGLLDFLDKICRENDIEYSLAGGSLLGSERHQGFIPWDGDIDVMLRRDYYEKLMPILSELEGNYQLHYYKKNIDYQNYAKFYDDRTILKSFRDQMYDGRIGVHIDIFPQDYLPDDKLERTKFLKEIFKMSEALASTGFPAYISGTKWYYQFARVFLRLPLFIKHHGKNREVAEELDQLMQKYDCQKTKEVGFVSSKYFDKEHFPSEIFNDYEDIKFEDLKVRKIKQHKVYLKQLFGDYMKLPAKKDQVDHDFYHWFWREGNDRV